MSLAQAAPVALPPMEGSVQAQSQLPSALFKGKKGAFRKLLAGLLQASGKEGKAEGPALGAGEPRSAKSLKNAVRLTREQAPRAAHEGALLEVGREAARQKPAVNAAAADEAGAKAAVSARADEGPVKKKARSADESGSQADAMALALFREREGKNRLSPERDKKTESVESKASERKERKGRGFTIDLQDLRRDAPEGSPMAEAGKKPLQQSSGGNERDMVIDLPSSQDRKDTRAAKAMGSTGASFSNRLAQALQDTYNQELVRNAQIILRDGDSGTIRLNLRPESLGSVKIALDLADNKVTGRIVVQSEAAREAFERNLDGLTQSFVDSGFGAASLEVAVDSRSSGGADARPDWAGGGGDRESSESAVAGAARYEAASASGALDLLA